MVQYERLFKMIHKCIENVKTRLDNKKGYHCHYHSQCITNEMLQK